MLVPCALLATAAELKRWELAKSPSTMVPALEQHNPPLMFNCRPLENTGLHPALASPIFGALTDRLAANARPSPEDLTMAQELCTLASRYHEREVRSPSVVHVLCLDGPRLWAVYVVPITW